MANAEQVLRAEGSVVETVRNAINRGRLDEGREVIARTPWQDAQTHPGSWPAIGWTWRPDSTYDPAKGPHRLVARGAANRGRIQPLPRDGARGTSGCG